jgi:1,4-alpha-glucan branching enzyme
MSVKKQYLKTKPVCKVTFRLPKEIAPGARKAAVAGEFNGWKTDEILMKQLKNGDFTATVVLKTGNEYQYRYIVDDQQWMTDTDADKYAESGFANCKNAVVVV